MPRTTPLQEWPGFLILDYPGWQEYRVETASANKRLSLRGIALDALLALAVSYYWKMITWNTYNAIIAASLLLACLHHRVTQILWESVIVLPSLGLQFETHRGFAGVPLSTTRRFIPWTSLEDFLINEGIRGWNIRYYLVAITRTQQGALKLEVAFENILPRFPILLEVYHAVQEALHAESEHTQTIRSSSPTFTDNEDNK
ncbi:GPI-GlcNAc transferase complex, PIG-H component-domain-containing protein [Trametes elegans]|nr:GPI-GlcNAc transferase complex, PIG-H component-domain-containing protein [Trametes elegans]